MKATMAEALVLAAKAGWTVTVSLDNYGGTEGVGVTAARGEWVADGVSMPIGGRYPWTASAIDARVADYLMTLVSKTPAT